MEELTQFERDALHLAAQGAMQIRLLCRLLPQSDTRNKILAIAEGMHNIPTVLAGSANERQANAGVLAGGVQELRAALGPNHVVG